MKHFAEARSEAFEAIIQDENLLKRIKRACLIWDIKGKLRFLFEGQEGEDLKDIQRQVSAILKMAAGSFWTEQTWVWSEDSSNPEKMLYENAWNEAELLHPGPPEIRILDRHFSKMAWFTPTLSEPWPLSEQTPPILSFFSFKGGVGRTTALVSLALQLARTGKKVAVIDLDLEAPGMASMLPGADGQIANYGVVDYLLERNLLKPEEIDIEDFYHLVDNNVVVGDGPPITVMPAGSLDDTYLEKLARIDYEALYKPPGQNEVSLSPLRELLKHVRQARQIDYMLLDARAGLHDLGGLSLSGVSHLDVIFGLDSEQSWRGMELVVRFLGRDRIERTQKQLECALVLALAPDPGKDREEAFQRFLERSYSIFSEKFYNEEDVDPEEGWPLPAMDASDQPHYPIILGFDHQVQRYRQVEDIADRLATGDFEVFAHSILERIGRTLT